MSSNNNETSAAAAAIGFVGAGVVLMAFFLFAVLAFIAFGLSILCLIALFKPVKLGNFTLEAKEAENFLCNGGIGAMLLVAFVLFCDLIFGLGVEWDYLPHMLGVGYVLGSVGVEILKANAEGTQKAMPEHQHTPPSPSHSPRQIASSAPPKEAFRFATWDDEENGR